MPVESAADRAGFFDTDEFAVAATFYPKAGPAVPCSVQRSSADLSGNLGDLNLNAMQTVLTVQFSEVGEVRGGRFVIGSETFAVDRGAELEETRTIWTVPVKPIEDAAQ